MNNGYYITVTLKPYNSIFFPVLATWNLGLSSYSNVFENREAAVRHLTSRYGKLRVIDHTTHPLHISIE